MPIETLRRYVAEGIPEFDAAYERALCERNQMVELLRELLTFLPDRDDALNYAAGNEGRVGSIHVAVAKAARLLADLEAKDAQVALESRPRKEGL